jgi:hypothetical protein
METTLCRDDRGTVRHMSECWGSNSDSPNRSGCHFFVVRSIESSIMSKQNGSPAKAPVHEVRLGRIKAAVWENTTENGVRHNVTISRLYKDGDPVEGLNQLWPG